MKKIKLLWHVLTAKDCIVMCDKLNNHSYALKHNTKPFIAQQLASFAMNKFTEERLKELYYIKQTEYQSVYKTVPPELETEIEGLTNYMNEQKKIAQQGQIKGKPIDTTKSALHAVKEMPSVAPQK